jgi:hypothetical protein
MNLGRVAQQRTATALAVLALGTVLPVAASGPAADVASPDEVRQLAPIARATGVAAPAGARVAGRSIPRTVEGDPVLHDNGPFVTHPGGGAGGADGSRLQDSSLAMTIYGFGHALSAAVRIADDFEVTDVGGWDISSISFFAYQTGSPTTSTIDHVNLRIWDGPPNDPASLVVFGDTTTNVLATSTWTNAYRELESAPGNNQRPIMEDIVTVVTHLDPGVYWLDWQTGGTLGSGPWAPPITIVGQTVTGDALQLLSGVWGPALDGTFAQGMPFIVRGLLADRMPFAADFEEADLSEWDSNQP